MVNTAMSLAVYAVCHGQARQGRDLCTTLRHFRLVGLDRTWSGRAVGEGERSVREPQAHKPSVRFDERDVENGKARSNH
jgi:hypothetical protein